MPKPEVTLENHAALNEYQAELRPSTHLLGALGLATALAYKPNVTFLGNSKQMIGQALENDTRLLMGCNHLNLTDQFPIMAILRSNQELRPIIGNAFVPGKVSYFQGSLSRWLFEKLGSTATFRDGDMLDASPKLALASINSFIKMCVVKTGRGEHIFEFPEGTRNKQDREVPARVKGIGRIAEAASRENIPVALVPIGLWHGDEAVNIKSLSGLRYFATGKWRYPSVCFGEPIFGPFENHRTANSTMNQAMRECVRIAIEQYRESQS